MIKIVSAATTAVLVLALLAASCTKVEPGYVGIVVNNYGTSKGVESYPLRTGRVFLNPFTEDMYKFPTFMQNVVWAHSEDRDESITVNSVEGATMNLDVGFGYAFVADSVPMVFTTFRKDAEFITSVYVRNILRDAFSRHASRMKAVDIFGSGKQSLLDSVKVTVQRQLGAKGMLVDQVSIIGAPRVDKQVQESINAVLSAAQRAIEAENKVRQSAAEGEQRVAAARADSSAVVTAAAGQAEANRMLQATVTPLILEKMKIEKWDGVLPTVTGGATPFISLPQKN